MIFKSHIALNRIEGLTTGEEKLKKDQEVTLDEVIDIFQEHLHEKHPSLILNTWTNRLENNGRAATPEEISNLFQELKKDHPHRGEINELNFYSFLNSAWMFSSNPMQDFFEENGDLKEYSAIPAIADCLKLRVNPELENYFSGNTKRMVTRAISELAINLVRAGLRDPANDNMILLSSPNTESVLRFYKQLLPSEFWPYYSQSNFEQDQDVRGVCESLLHVYSFDNFNQQKLKQLSRFIHIDSFDYLKENELKLDRARLATLAATCTSFEFEEDDFLDVFPFIITDIDWEKFTAIDKKAVLMEAYNLYSYDVLDPEDPQRKFLLF